LAAAYMRRDLIGMLRQVAAAAALLAGGLLVALVCTRAGGDGAGVGIAALQQNHGSVQSLSSILGVDSQGRRAIERLISKTEMSWQVCHRTAQSSQH